jgi:uncharacterized protein (DUF1778 family)
MNQLIPFCGVRVSGKVRVTLKQAQRVIDRGPVIRLSREDTRKVCFLVTNPQKPNERLRDAVKVWKNSVRA